MNRRIVKGFLFLIAMCAFVFSMLSTAPGELAARKQDTFVLRLPIVMNLSGGDPRKGVAGFTFNPTVTSTRSYRQMGVTSFFNWQTMLTSTWNATNAYPLPNQPYNDFRSLPGLTWFSMFRLGLSCDTTQAALAQCAADAVRGQGAITVLVGNEPDGNDTSTSDSLPAAVFAADFYTVSSVLRAANPQVSIIAGNYLWPNANYHNAFVAAYRAAHGVDPLQPQDKLGFHAYANFGWTGAGCNSPAHYPQDAQCVSDAFGRVLAGIQQAAGSRGWWVTELGISGGAETAQADYAAMLPDMCRQLRASNAEKFFEFVGSDYAPTPNSWLLQPDGTESVLGHAYESC